MKGTYREMGEQYGALIKGRFQPPPASEAKRRFAEECEALTRRYAPGVVEEIEGLSSAAEVDAGLMKCFVLTLGLEPGCTVFAVSGAHTNDGAPIYGRNYDWDISFQKFFTPMRLQLVDGNTSLVFTDHFVGVYGGVNHEGLAAAITAIPAYRGKPRPGVRMNVALRWILDNHETTEEAAEWLSNTPHQWAHNYLLADKKGRLARVETSPEMTRVQHSDEFITTTNHYHHPEMKELENPDYDYTNTHTRYTNIENWHQANPDNVTLDQIKHLLSDHDTGVCNHYEHQGVKGGTIWSWIAPLGKRRAHVCHGPPCSNPYETIDY
ncbi:hypothetical protein KAT55_00480 [Candidatus Bathyarchaeota archaeon]|nr:hypothetical protein [Candidatus Bathyarchaeota archaeon]